MVSIDSVKAGIVFGRLRAVEGSRDANGNRTWLCLCECGASAKVRAYDLAAGRQKSCGCYKRSYSAHLSERLRLRHGYGRHTGGKRTPTYNSWNSMKQRCGNPKNSDYQIYGGRGIRVCLEWESFEAFLSDMGERPEGKTLDRIDPDGNYCPGNCRWSTPLEQRHNRRTA